ADRRLHAVPPVVRLVPRPAPRDQRARSRALAGVRRLSRHHPAEGRPGRRHAVRRRRGDGAARRRCRGGAACPLRRRPGRRPRPPARDRAGSRRAPARRRPRLGARRRAGADPPVRALRGLRRAHHRALLRREAVDRPLRRGRGRAARDGGLRRRPATPAGHPRPRRVGGGGVLQRGARGRPGVPPLHAPGPVARVDRAGGPAVGPPRQHPRVAGTGEPPPGGLPGRRRPWPSATI
ncbi:MAG: tRNA (guanine(37)-N(1))-methyltransferase, partial [uncultured Solirubrobacteraceae bacterium]